MENDIPRMGRTRHYRSPSAPPSRRPGERSAEELYAEWRDARSTYVADLLRRLDTDKAEAEDADADDTEQSVRKRAEARKRLNRDRREEAVTEGAAPLTLAMVREWFAYNEQPIKPRELAAALGLSGEAAVWAALAALVNAGVVEQLPGRERLYRAAGVVAAVKTAG